MAPTKTTKTRHPDITVPLRADGRTLPEAFLERMAECRQTIRSNCIGTALYIVGEYEKDEAGDIFKIHPRLTKLPRVSRPVIGCLASWERGPVPQIVVAHLGVVTSLHPLLVTERQGSDGEFLEDTPFPRIHRDYNTPSYGRHKVFFYLPSSLGKDKTMW